MYDFDCPACHRITVGGVCTRRHPWYPEVLAFGPVEDVRRGRKWNPRRRKRDRSPLADDIADATISSWQTSDTSSSDAKTADARPPSVSTSGDTRPADCGARGSASSATASPSAETRTPSRDTSSRGLASSLHPPPDRQVWCRKCGRSFRIAVGDLERLCTACRMVECACCGGPGAQTYYGLLHPRCANCRRSCLTPGSGRNWRCNRLRE